MAAGTLYHHAQVHSQLSIALRVSCLSKGRFYSARLQRFTVLPSVVLVSLNDCSVYVLI
jgi:hypothetical protein